ncbi:MAG: hypothetical protein MK105_05620 [Crocinitomicaceae bacterium]|nr:hypothetical protein [Crocinitomicaceae bacterium]
MNKHKSSIQVLHHNSFDGRNICELINSNLENTYSIEAIRMFKEIKDSANSTVVIANPNWILDKIPEASFKNLLESSKSNFIVLSKKSKYHFLNSEKVKVIQPTTTLKEVLSEIQEFQLAALK